MTRQYPDQDTRARLHARVASAARAASFKSAFATDILSCDPLFSYTSWDRSAFLTSFGQALQRRENHQVGHLPLRLRSSAPSRIPVKIRRKPEARIAAHPAGGRRRRRLGVRSRAPRCFGASYRFGTGRRAVGGDGRWHRPFPPGHVLRHRERKRQRRGRTPKRCAQQD
jgi:hypothetical protein